MEIGEEKMAIESNPKSGLSRSSHSALFHLQCLFADTRKAPKNPLQKRWERRWTAASGAWVAVLLALLLGGIDWRMAVMVAATTFMLARGGDMLDNSDD